MRFCSKASAIPKNNTRNIFYMAGVFFEIFLILKKIIIL